MSGTFRARMKGGHLELFENVDIPEDSEVSVTIIDTRRTDDADAKPGHRILDIYGALSRSD